MGLAGETGEVVDYLKKVLYQGKPYDIDKIADELGDLAWYVSALATTLDITLESIAQMNIDKLYKRYPNGFSEEASNRRSNEI